MLCVVLKGKEEEEEKAKQKQKVLGITFAHTSLTHENTINQLSHFQNEIQNSSL